VSHRSRIPAERVQALWRRVAGDLVLAAFFALILGVGALLLAAWVLGASELWRRPSPLPLLLWLAVAAVTMEWLRRLMVRGLRWDRRAAAREIERRVGLPRGSVLGAVEDDSDRPGLSRSLLELHRQRIGGLLERKVIAELGADRARDARWRAQAAALVALLFAAAVGTIWWGARESATRAWAGVAHPVRHLSSPPLPPVALLADSTHVRRGRDLAVRIEAPKRDSVQLFWRPRGDVATRRWERLSDHVTHTLVPRVEAPTRVWAVAPDGASSDTLRIEPVDPLLLVDARIELHYPPHSGRPRDVLAMPFPPLVVPEGTRATVTGSATLPLRRAALRAEGEGAIDLEVRDERRFQGSFAVQAGKWSWDIEGTSGEPLEGWPDSLEFSVVADSAPAVYVVYPGVDTIMPLSMVQSLVVDGRDDHGLSRLEVVSWRVSAWGERWPERVDSLPVPDSVARVNIASTLDATGRGLLPGDTLHYYVRAFDNAPVPHEGRSEEYVLRLATLDEVRERAVADADDLIESTESLAERARQQQQAVESLQRSLEVQPAPGTPQRTDQSEQGLEFRETQAARQSLEQAQALMEQAREIEESLRQLQESVERAGLNDSSLVERLREIESLFRRVITPELAERIEELRDALGTLDPARVREAIRRLAEGSDDLRQRVEQTLELLRRAALEQEFAVLESQAEELAATEARLEEALRDAARVDSADDRLKARAQELGRRSEELARRIDELAGQLQAGGEDDAASRADEAEARAQDASRSNQAASRSLPQDASRAAAAAARGEEQLQQAAAALREGRQGMQQRWREQVVEAMSRARAEALELARRQERVNESLRDGGAEEEARRRSDQGALRRGVDQIEEQLSQAARATLLVDPELLQAAAAAGAAMDELLGEMSEGGGGRGRSRPQPGEEAAAALNRLAYRLMQAQDAASSAQSGTGLQEALQQLSQLAEQQGRLSSEAGGSLPLPTNDALMRELQRLAGRQRAIGEQLRELGRSLGPRGQVLGRLDQMGQEAEDLARELERGRLDEELVERQRRLFRRLLDAGRTLERDEFERERQAERPKDPRLFQPDELPTDLLQGLRFPHPESERLRVYPPAIRRLILEYFDLLNERGGSDGS